MTEARLSSVEDGIAALREAADEVGMFSLWHTVLGSMADSAQSTYDRTRQEMQVTATWAFVEHKCKREAHSHMPDHWDVDDMWAISAKLQGSSTSDG